MKDIEQLINSQAMITETGYAKINLGLDVTGRLDNGYHLVKMIMESISLHDIIDIKCVSGSEIKLSCNREDLSCGEDNLIVKAARAILSEAGISNLGLEIKLEKNIPMAAGMAGGSTDAAAALRAINKLLELNYSEDKLCEIGVKLGADIPYCIMGGSKLSEGIGEILTTIPDVPNASICVIKPAIDVSTKYVYEHLDSDGVQCHPDIDGMIDAMAANDLGGVCSRLGNVLRDVTVNKYPVILELEDYLKQKGALGSLMSGSGPTVFGIFDDRELCQAVVNDAKKIYPDMFVEEAEFVL